MIAAEISSLAKGYPSLADGFGDALGKRRGGCLGLAQIWQPAE